LSTSDPHGPGPDDTRPDGSPDPHGRASSPDQPEATAPTSPPPYGGPPAYGSPPGGGPWREQTRPLLGGFGAASGYGGPPPVDPWGTAGPSRTPWVGVVVLALVLGFAAGAGGAALVAAVNGTSSDQTPIPSQVGANPAVAVSRSILPSVVSIQLTEPSGTITGSGFVWDDKGDIVTNNHVVRDASRGAAVIQVTVADGDQRAATLVGRSPAYDLAVIKVDNPSGLVPVRLGDSDAVEVGQTVVAVGSPLGLRQSVTEGIISALDRPVTVGGQGETSYLNALQTDAAINPGNSGGPLVDLDARIVGVDSAIATVGQSSGQSTEAGNIGVGFAIPVNQVATTVRQLIAHGSARYPVIGARVDVSSTAEGASVSEVDNGSPAAGAGLHPGDVIESVDGRSIMNGIELIVTIRAQHPGDQVEITYRRDGRSATVTLTLASKVG
jgi:putative serine protease PepD